MGWGGEGTFDGWVEYKVRVEWVWDHGVSLGIAIREGGL